MEESSKKASPYPDLAGAVGPQLALTALRALGWSYRLRPALRDVLRVGRAQGPNARAAFAVNFATVDGHSQVWIRVEQDRLRSGPGRLTPSDGTVLFRDESELRRFLVQSAGSDILALSLEGGAFVEGSLICVAKFAHIAAAARHTGLGGTRSRRQARDEPILPEIVMRRGDARAFGAASGAIHLREPAFPDLTLEDLPGLRRCLESYLLTRPRISVERAQLFTEAIVNGSPDATPVVQRALALAHVLGHRQPIVHEGLSVLGTTTEHRIGAPVYPELDGTLLWPELGDPDHRATGSCGISHEDAQSLANDVLPAWMFDGLRHHWRMEPHGELRDGRFIIGEPEGLASAVPDFKTVLNRGLRVLSRESRDAASAAPTQAQKDFHASVATCLDAVCDYAVRVAEEAERVARELDDATWREALHAAALSSRRAPAAPAETLLDALNAIRICIACVHQESFNAASGLGRLDVLLQPFFERDLERAPNSDAREAVAVAAVELVASFFLSLSDHVPLRPRALTALHPGGAYQAVTIGGALADGSSAVCDMTYVILKASELLAIPAPHLHARFAPAVNPDYYLRRVCEVGVLTGASPSIHTDPAYATALDTLQAPSDRGNDWAITHAGTPTLAGEHVAHPYSAIIHLPHALAAAHVTVQAKSERTRERDILSDVLRALRTEMSKLAREALDSARTAAETLAQTFPTPLLSALVQGTSESGMDISAGGARYNSSCVRVTGFSDVVERIAALQHAADGSPLDDAMPIERIADIVLEIVDVTLRSQAPIRGGRFIPSYCGISSFAWPYAVTRSRSRRMAGGMVVQHCVPAGDWSHAEHVDRVLALARSFCATEGMHLQVATVDPAVLHDAELDPTRYRDVIVPVHGVDAFYVELSDGLRATLRRDVDDASARQVLTAPAPDLPQDP